MPRLTGGPGAAGAASIAEFFVFPGFPARAEPNSGVARANRADGRAAAVAGVAEAISRRRCPG